MDSWKREKFSEPRGWALNWVLAQEVVPSTVAQEMPDDDGAWEKFAEPRGWALKWDGFALDEAGEGQDVPGARSR